MLGGLRKRPVRKRKQSRSDPDGGDGKGNQRSADSGDVVLGRAKLGNAQDPVGCERNGKREHDAKTEDGERSRSDSKAVMMSCPSTSTSRTTSFESDATSGVVFESSSSLNIRVGGIPAVAKIDM